MQQAGQNPQQQILIGEPPVQAMEEQQNNECHPWPEEIPAQQLALAQGVNLNLAPPILEQDLNELPMAEDSQEILIHPMAQENPQANNADEQVQNIMPIIHQPKEQNRNDLQEEVAEN